MIDLPDIFSPRWERHRILKFSQTAVVDACQKDPLLRDGLDAVHEMKEDGCLDRVKAAIVPEE